MLIMGNRMVSNSNSKTEYLRTLIYPSANSKVTNPDILFRWFTRLNADRYQFVLYEGIVNVVNGKYRINYKKIVDTFTRDTRYRCRLKKGSYYACWVYPHERDTKFDSGSLVPIPGTINPQTGEVDPWWIPPTIYDIPEEKRPASSWFFVKDEQNYLAKYLDLKKFEDSNKRQKPIIPLLFLQLERYLKGECNTENPFDRAFLKTMENVPSKLRVQLPKIMKSYKLVPKELKKRFSGQDLSRLPENIYDLQWAEQAFVEIFKDCTTIKPLIPEFQGPKKMTFDFKVPLGLPNSESPLIKGCFDLKIKRSNLRDRKFDPNKEYFLKILSSIGNSLTDIKLIFSQDSEYYIFSSRPIPKNNLDSTVFGFELMEKDNSTLSKIAYGKLIVEGGNPEIFLSNPSTIKQTSMNTQVKIYIRNVDGPLERAKIILKGQDGNPNYTIPTNGNLRPIWDEQTLYYNVFEFTVSDYHPTNKISEGKYILCFESDQEYNSEIEFYVQSTKYEIRITQLECRDESNPEWWGDDTVFYQLVVGTKYFCQDIKQSGKYNKYHDRKIRECCGNGSRYLKEKDVLVYTLAGPRVIEDFLSIGVSLFEYDNWGFIADIIDFIVDFITDYLISMLCRCIDCIIPGLGVVLNIAFEVGFELSGFNDIREQAINSMISGMEVELLSTNSMLIRPPIVSNPAFRTLRLKGKDSLYYMRFILDST